MIKTRTGYRLLYVVCDLITTLIGVVIFELMRYHLVPGLVEKYPETILFMRSLGVRLTALFFPLCMLLVYYLTGYYVNVSNKSRAKEFLQTLSGVAIGSLILFLTVLLNDLLPRRRYNYEMIILIFVCIFPAVYCGRLLLTTIIKHRQKATYRIKRALYVTVGGTVGQISEEVESAVKEAGLCIAGSLNIDSASKTDEADIEKAVIDGKIDCFVFEVPKDEDEAFRILGALMKTNLPVMVRPTPTRVLLGVVKYDSVVTTPLVDVTDVSLPDSAVAVKRALDILISGLGLLLTLPLTIPTALMVKITSAGPVFYKQERLGLNRQPFRLYKFRTMVADSEPEGPRLTTTNDRRITRVGRVLRRYRLDELPNLWNVLIGDMSLVGPRPERSYFASRIIAKAPHYLLVYRVRPGVTSWGMVKFGYASDVDQMVERLTYDILYLQNLSLSLDIKILFYTVRTILRGEGK